ncbi:hypothetical protein DD109_18255 [Clostridioides difficile]|nr:hypothetical protein [Clostridioides difficile]
MWGRFKNMSIILKVLVLVCAIAIFPITLLAFSIEFVVKSFKRNERFKVVFGVFLVFITFSFVCIWYLLEDNITTSNSSNKKQEEHLKEEPGKNLATREAEEETNKKKEQEKQKNEGTEAEKKERDKTEKKEKVDKKYQEKNKEKAETKKQTLTSEELKKKVESIISSQYKGNYYTNDILDTDGSYVLSLQVQNASFDNESSCKAFTKDLINKLKEFRIDSAEVYFVGSSGQTTYQINIDDFLKVQDNINSVDNMEFFSFKDFKN